MQDINFYSTRDAYGELSNFAPYRIHLKQRSWPSSEHYFQAQKFPDHADEEEIRLAANAREAAQMGRERHRPLRPDWEEVKETVMLEALRAKFTQHRSLQELLLGTGDVRLVEHTRNDAYWGDGGDGTGRNRLGVLLMQVRAELRSGGSGSEAGVPTSVAALPGGPLVTRAVHEQITAASKAGAPTIECSLDLQRSMHTVSVDAAGWSWQGRRFPHLQTCKDRTVYYWSGTAFEPVARYSSSLIKLIPTQWGTPTFEIDGIKMLVSEHVSPYADAEGKVDLVRPHGKHILDTCGGLGYFAVWCLQRGAAAIQSYEKNPDVLWLRSLNPWSPAPDKRLQLMQGDVAEQIAALPAACFDAALHDPPRFGIAGELYSKDFYAQLARVLKRGGQLFHYVGAPNRLTSGRDVPREVVKRLGDAGFSAQLRGDGILAVKRGR